MRWNGSVPMSSRDKASGKQLVNLAQIRKEETRKRIVETASRLFQERGVDGVGVDEIMRESGLTHGGFYGHFRNKEQLIAEACACAVEKKTEETKARLKGVPKDEAFALFVSEYLDCTDDADCPFAMLGGDVARRGEEVREMYTAEVRDTVDYMTRSLGCGREEALLAFAAVVGATSVAKASSDPALAEEIVRTVREQLVRIAAERCGAKAPAAA